MSEDLRELAAERAALDLMAERVMAAKKDVAARMQAALDAAEKATGQDRVTAALPDGTEVATITLRKGAVGPVVTDPSAFMDWLRTQFGDAAYREWTKVTMVRTVREWKAAELLGAMGALDLSPARPGESLRAAQWADPDTGEIVDVPGVHIKPTSARTHARTWKAGGKEALVAAYLAGDLTPVVQRALAPVPAANDTTDGGEGA